MLVGLVAVPAAGCVGSDSGSKCLPTCIEGDWPTPTTDGPADTSTPDGGGAADIQMDAPEAAPEVMDAACSADGFFGCAVSAIGDICSDVAEAAVCVDGVWRCLGGVPLSQCKCIGALAPGCTCTDQGIRCAADAGSDGDAGGGSQ